VKTSLSFCLVIVGGLLMAVPVLVSQWHLRHIARFFEQHGTGSVLPAELHARPFARLDWGCFTAGAGMVLGGAWAGRGRR
jgi:hypothetical protein